MTPNELSMKPTMVILRGLPGSGKTTWLKKTITEMPTRPHWVSADDFFVKNGVYFDPRMIGEAHAQCFREAIGHFDESIGRANWAPIIIDNTNTQLFEIAPYVQLANAFMVDCRILTFWCDPIVAHARNTHGVPLATVMRMYSNLLESNANMPPFWRHEVIG